MTIDALQAAKYLAQKSGWKLTRLELQKIIYLAHMVFLGGTGDPLVGGEFQAWDYGPVHPELYYFAGKVKSLVPPESLFDFIQDLDPSQHAGEIDILEKMLKEFPPGSARELIRITHWTKGAWAACYDEERKGIVIPPEEIEREYEARSVPA